MVPRIRVLLLDDFKMGKAFLFCGDRPNVGDKTAAFFFVAELGGVGEGLVGVGHTKIIFWFGKQPADMSKLFDQLCTIHHYSPG